MFIGESVFAVPGRGESCNSYVLVGGEEYVLVDPGLPRPFEEIAKPLTGGGLELKRIRRVVNTHCHVDHIGADWVLDEALGPEFYVHSLDLVYVQSGDPLFTLAEEALKPVSANPLEDGDLVPGTSFEVIHTPGHTMGSVCLFERDEGVLISGDTVFAQGVGRFDLPGGDLESLEKSVERVAGLDFEKLLPGHGMWLESGGAEAAASGLEYIKGFRSCG